MGIQIVKIVTVLGLCVSLSLSKTGFSQDLSSYTFEEILRLQQKEPRPVLVYLTADWCTYCERIDNTSFKEEEIIKSLNKNYYFVEFDIEQKISITLGGTTFKYNPTSIKSGVHELAEIIGTVDGVLNTPTFILMNSKFEIIYKYGGYLDTKQIQTLLEANS
ncbi:MAG: thioredoxin fold domain-containing protein [Balneolaceae bacterium]